MVCVGKFGLRAGIVKLLAVDVTPVATMTDIYREMRQWKTRQAAHAWLTANRDALGLADMGLSVITIKW